MDNFDKKFINVFLTMNSLHVRVLTEVVLIANQVINNVSNKMFYVKLLPVPQKILNLSYTFDEANIVFLMWMVSSI